MLRKKNFPDSSTKSLGITLCDHFLLFQQCANK